MNIPSEITFVCFNQYVCIRFILPLAYPRWESNPDILFRRESVCPLAYKGVVRAAVVVEHFRLTYHTQKLVCVRLLPVVLLRDIRLSENPRAPGGIRTHDFCLRKTT